MKSNQTYIFENRIDVLKNKYNDMLNIKFTSDKNNFNIANIFDYFVSLDPTPNKKYLQYIINLYLRNNLKLEDCYKVNEYLNLFKDLKISSDINKFKTLPELYAFIEANSDIKSKKQEKFDTKNKIFEQIKTIYSGSEGKVYVPLTKDASCFLGQSTQWCTAAKNNNMFDYYNNKGPLYVIVNYDGSRYQLHIEFNQLMDVNDSEVNVKKFKEKYSYVFDIPEIKNSIFSNIDINPYLIQFIDNPSIQVQLAAVQKNGYAIQYINNPSIQVQLAAVQKDGYAIYYIDNPSKVVKLAAVQKNGDAIRYIDNPSLEVQLAAVKQNGYAIEYINNPSLEVQLAAVQQNGNAIRYINNPSIQVQLAAVQKDGYAIQYINNTAPEVIKLHNKLYPNNKYKK